MELEKKRFIFERVQQILSRIGHKTNLCMFFYALCPENARIFLNFLDSVKDNILVFLDAQ
jgi:hypothetical protein